jgi:hypothetical protein
MIHEHSTRKRPGGGHTLSLEVLNLHPSIYHRRFIGHSCSTFIQHTSPPRRGHCKHRQASELRSADSMKWVPSIIFLQRTLLWRNTAQILARQLPSEYQDDGNSGDDPNESLTLLLSHSLTGRVPADLRSQTSQFVGALVISRWTVPHTPLTLRVVGGTLLLTVRQSTSRSFAADVSIKLGSVMWSRRPPSRRGPSTRIPSLHDWSLDPQHAAQQSIMRPPDPLIHPFNSPLPSICGTS